MRFARCFALGLSLVALACGGGDGSSSSACQGDACNGGCPQGFRPDVEGTCLDVTPKDACLAGAAPFLGNESCTPVAARTCDAPFVPDASGWGCALPLADAPVGGCNDPFPPSNATIFVDPNAPEDATHKKSVFAAAIAASSGAVIAVSPGHYVEDVDVSVPMTIVGRCADQVVIENPGDRRAGMLVTSKGVTIRGVTLKGHTSGVYVKGAADVTLEDAILDSNKWMGLYVLDQGHAKVARTRIVDTVPDATGAYGWGAAAQQGGSIDLEDTAILRSVGEGIVMANAGSKLTLTRSVVKDTREDAKGFSFGVSVAGGAEATITESAIVGSTIVNLHVADAGSIATLTRSYVADSPGASPTGPNASRDDTGRGVQVIKGGHVELVGSLVAHNAGDAVVFLGSSGSLTSSIVTGSVDDPAPGRGGVLAAQGSTVDLTDTAIVQTREVGLIAQDPGTSVTASKVLVAGTRPANRKGPELGYGVGVAWAGHLEMTDSAVVDNYSAGMLVTRVDQDPATASLTRTFVAKNRPTKDGILGRGVEVDSGGQLTLEACAIADNHELGLLVGMAGSQATVHATVVRTSVQNAPGDFGDGILGADGSSVAIDRSWILRHPGIGLAFAGASASVSGSVVLGNAIGIHVQDGATLQEVSGKQDPSGTNVDVTSDTRFVDNQTKADASQLPLPQPISDAPKKQ